MSQKSKYVAYVGTYTFENSVGIHVYDVDPKAGKLTERSVAPISNPSYLCVSADKKFLYSIEDEGVASFTIDENGDLTKVNSKWIGGMRGCYLCVDSQRRYLFVSGFHDGRVTMMRLNEDGSIEGIADGIFHQGLANSVNNRRLDHPKVSCVMLTPDEKFLLASDHGLNQVKVYYVDYKRGKLRLADTIRCEMDAEPRTLRFSGDGKHLYILDELLNEIEVYNYRLDGNDPVFEKIQQLPVLIGDDSAAESTCMNFTEDGKYLYVTIDGFNGISLLAVRNDGTLALECSMLTSGYFPKSIMPIPESHFIAVLNHDNNEIRTFQVFKEDLKYFILGKNAPVKVDKPNCIKIVKLG